MTLQLRIPIEHADAVRKTLHCKTCDDTGVKRNLNQRWKERCPDCPTELWWGVVGDWKRSDDVRAAPWPIKEPPADVQAMLDPCKTCSGKAGWSGYVTTALMEPLPCSRCLDGRPLVELVTDCDHPIGRDRCRHCDNWMHGTVTLATVTAREVLGLLEWSDRHPDASYFGPPDATHAIRLEVVN